MRQPRCNGSSAPRVTHLGRVRDRRRNLPVRHLRETFFKVMELGSALGLTVGDIAGKGLSAGIWQAHLMGLIRRCARRHSDPAAAVAEINAELCTIRMSRRSRPCSLPDSMRKRMNLCTVRRPAAPLLLRHNKTVERLEKGGPMLGALQEAAYDSGSVRLNPGDMLLAYSDGVTSAGIPRTRS